MAGSYRTKCDKSPVDPLDASPVLAVSPRGLHPKIAAVRQWAHRCKVVAGIGASCASAVSFGLEADSRLS